MKKIALVFAMALGLMAFKCERPPQPDPRSTCGPKVPLSECIK